MKPTIVGLAALGLLACAKPVSAEPRGSEKCAVMIAGPDGKVTVRADPELHVLGGPERLMLRDEHGVQAILCGRASPIPEVGDERVLMQLHMPLYLTDDDGRIVALVMVNGQLQVRFEQGGLRENEEALMQQRLNEMQRRVNG